MSKLLLFFIAILFFSCGQTKYKDPHVKIYTSLGDIVAEVYPGKAPVSAQAFLSYVDKGYYNNGAFYRVILQEGASAATNTGLIQGGTWQAAGRQHDTIPGIEHEPTTRTGLSHTDGTLSLARTTLGSANTEFFICIGDQRQFDDGNGRPEDGKGFAAFGRVTEGMDIVRKIQQQRGSNESFDKKIEIYKITRL